MIKYILKRILELYKINYLKKILLNKKRTAVSFGDVRNILCIQMNAIGDGIMTQPVWSAIKSKIPDARIDLVCRPHVAPIFKNDHSIDAIYEFEPKNYRNWLFKRKSEIDSLLINGNYDLLIDFTALPLTAAICAKNNAPPSIGFNRLIRTIKGEFDIGLAYDVSFDYSKLMPIRELMGKLISPWYNSPQKKFISRIEFDNNIINRAKKILSNLNLEEKKFVVLHPGAKWVPKKWPSSYWRKLFEVSLQFDLLPYLIIGNHEDEKFILDIVSDNRNPGIHSLVNENIDVAAALIKMARLCVCNDSAAMHISAAVGTPSIAIFGPVSPERSAPGIDERCTVMYNNDFCSPCTLYYAKKRCRRGINFCMYSIDPSKVLNNIKTICQS